MEFVADLTFTESTDLRLVAMSALW